jgi:predicted O-methyltransferase YrrM
MSRWMDDRVEHYLTDLAALGHEDPLLVEMEAYAAERKFPIVGRATGRYLEFAARAVGARRVMELGSGFGYSAYWFARAVGPTGEVVCTDGDPANAERARGYLDRAGVLDRVRYRVGDALAGFAEENGEFDVVYCDVDKDGYPDCWRAARDRIRVGGLWLCDNVIWDGRVAEPDPDAWTAAIDEHNRMIASDDRYVASIVPIRDGVMSALRIR